MRNHEKTTQGPISAASQSVAVCVWAVNAQLAAVFFSFAVFPETPVCANNFGVPAPTFTQLSCIASSKSGVQASFQWTGGSNFLRVYASFFFTNPIRSQLYEDYNPVIAFLLKVPHSM